MRTQAAIKAPQAAAIQEELKQICERFKLGQLRSWRTEEPEQTVKGYILTSFNTTTAANLKHWLKIQ